MKTLKQLALVAMAVAVSAVPALAGTKYAANLVTNDAFDPPTPPTLSPKSAVKLDDKGDLRVVALATRDIRPGFRYAIKSVSKEGIKTVDGKPLPKE